MPRKKTLNKAEKIYLSKVREIGGIACLKINRISEAVIHHIRKHTGLGLRPAFDQTIPLCPQHHNMGNESIHLNKKVFVKKFGSEQSLLKETQELIKQQESNYLFNG